MSTRFIFPEKRGLRVINNKNLLAFFDFVDTETGLQYADWKLMSGSNGLFIGSPAGEPYNDRNGKKQYPDFVRAAYDASSPTKRNARGDAFINELKEAAVAVYNQLNGGEAVSQPRYTTAGSAVPSGRSGAGPMPRQSQLADPDEIPF